MLKLTSIHLDTWAKFIHHIILLFHSCNARYGTQCILPNGDFFLIGGRRSFSYEYIPRVEGKASEKVYFFPFLYETSDIDENNLYPFVHLSTDGNLFIMSNNRSLLHNPNTNKVVRTFPVLPGGSRNYPASGMSALLPINLANATNNRPIKAEVIVCGGNTHDAFYLAETQKVFLPALRDCNRYCKTLNLPQPINISIHRIDLVFELFFFINNQNKQRLQLDFCKNHLQDSWRCIYL